MQHTTESIIQKVELFDLPNCVLTKILGNLSYDEIAQRRRVSKRFDTTCRYLLNSGFRKMTQLHAKRIESFRLKNPPADSVFRKQLDVLQSIDSRIRSLTMTYANHIEMGLCCFIPGLIIDEVLKILRTISDGNPLVNSSNVRARGNHAHEILRELREMSSKAMAHFRQNIRPVLLAQTASCTL